MKCKHNWTFKQELCSEEEVKNASTPFRWLQSDLAEFICSECGEIKTIKIK